MYNVNALNCASFMGKLCFCMKSSSRLAISGCSLTCSGLYFYTLYPHMILNSGSMGVLKPST
ncbi:hypothetical protein OIU76_020749 [Salix suchowensis]|nr:hypothetical protein OIU76_020749 [Salix suchowensis]